MTVCFFSISACGSGGGGGSSSGSTSSGTTRRVSGTLSGDLTHIASVIAVDLVNGTTSRASLSRLRQREKQVGQAGTGQSSSYSLELNIGGSYNIKFADSSDKTVAVMEWSTAQNSRSTTSVLNITDGNEINLGNTSVSTGTDASKVTLVSSTNNPLKDLDNDDDGESDFDDNDDDNDGIDDEDDEDDDGDGVDDEDEENDEDEDGISDKDDEDSEDNDNDNDGENDDLDEDDDNDGTNDEEDEDVDDEDECDDEDEEEECERTS